MDVAESSKGWVTVMAVKIRFRFGRVPGCRDSDPCILQEVSERTSIVGCETRKKLSSVEINSKPDKEISRRDAQVRPEKRGDAVTVLEWGFA